MLAPGVTLEVPVCFAPREVKDYAFAVPFVVNGTGKLNVNVVGRGALARLEMANPSQRKVCRAPSNTFSTQYVPFLTFLLANISTQHTLSISLYHA